MNKEFKIYAYADASPDMVMVEPFLINYNTLGLHKKRTFIKGEVTMVEYYAEYDPIEKEYSELILTEERIYHRENGLAYKRDMKISWFYLDNTVGAIKETVKYYPPDESIKEGIRRRNNIISNMKMICFSQLGPANGYDLLAAVYAEIGLYKDGYTLPLIEALGNIDKSYLDDTEIAKGLSIRTYLVSEMTI